MNLIEYAKAGIKVPYNTTDLNREQPLDISWIKSVVAQYFNIEEKYMTVRTRKREYAYARQVAMYLLREKYKMRFAEIGEIFSRDHATAIHSHTVISSLISVYKDHKEKVEHLYKLI